jgi:hypothetical protein
VWTKELCRHHTIPKVVLSLHAYMSSCQGQLVLLAFLGHAAFSTNQVGQVEIGQKGGAAQTHRPPCGHGKDLGFSSLWWEQKTMRAVRVLFLSPEIHQTPFPDTVCL